MNDIPFQHMFLLRKPLLAVCIVLLAHAGIAREVHFRINELGYLPGDFKEALLASEKPVDESFQLINMQTADVQATVTARRITNPAWGSFSHYYRLNFTEVRVTGAYRFKGSESGVVSPILHISPDAYAGKPDILLEFMRQQRCGYNPFLNMVCHQKDGRSFYGPMPDSTYVDVSGGWHDAGDQLKYLITGSYATAHMLKAYALFPEQFADKTNALGQPRPNDLPDVLDEAKWGLDWIHKMHPRPNQLIHQVADDRDHMGWKMPNKDNADYGWGKNSYRPAYFANGKPQGLRKYKSEATGVANLAGRSAAAMALGAQIWQEIDTLYAQKCLHAALSLYRLGKSNEGFQQGNSYGAPYRYNERTWADDMEWAAAELYNITGQAHYLTDAKGYARKASTVSWMNRDTAAHYALYPFVNIGHFALHPHVNADFQDTLEGYYRNGIAYNLNRSRKTPYRIGVPFIWCSNNLLTGLITQIILYQQMTGDRQYNDFLHLQRDWLFGHNPWGTSMFTGIPEGGEYPEDVHTSIRVLTGVNVPGGLVDGPVFRTIYQSLKGLQLSKPDEFAQFQNKHVVYHDDVGDYSTNEPTMDGTAGSILLMAYWAAQAKRK